MSEHHLTPYQFDSEQSRVQAAINGRKGGQTTQRKRREAAEARQVAKTILNLLPDLTPGVIDAFAKLGMDKRKKKYDIREISTLAIAQKAMRGDKQSYEFLIELAGEAEKAPTVNINTFIGAEGTEDNQAVVRETMDRMSDEQLRVFEEICALYSEVEAEHMEKAGADNDADGIAKPIKVEADGSVV